MLTGETAQAGGDATLADIRQDLAALNAEVQSLNAELQTSGTGAASIGGSTGLDRLNAMNAQLADLTAQTEALEFRINRVVSDGTNRIGDLEFRLCELEPGCDIGQLGDTPSLGGTTGAAPAPAPAPAPQTGGPELAVSEQADFERASEALAQGDFQGAADQFAAFVETYPGGALSGEALLRRGDALTELGDRSGAARAYLDAFSGDPASDIAAEALLKLGTALVALGQTQDACVTLGEVETRFPGAPEVAQAQAARASAGCQ
nr:tol-pal system protein YbgF [Pseudoroseicyclus aestuarii]